MLQVFCQADMELCEFEDHCPKKFHLDLSPIVDVMTFEALKVFLLVAFIQIG